MKRKRWSVEQIIAVLKQAEPGAPVADLIHHLGIAERTVYRWNRRDAGLESEQVRQFKHLQEENAKLKRLVADLSLDKVLLQDGLATNGTALRQRITDLARTRVRDGYRKIRVLLNREGWSVGTHLVHRLYREEGVTLRHRPPRRRKAGVVRTLRPVVTRPHETWTLDFVADPLANGHRIRALPVVDGWTRESLAIEVGPRLRSDHVVQVLTRLTPQRGAPRRLFGDHGSECCSQLVDPWADQHQVQLDFSRPGKPPDTAPVKSFNASFRRACLHVHWFASLHEAQARIEAWRRESTASRPHRALHDQTPAEFAQRAAENPRCEPAIPAGHSPWNWYRKSGPTRGSRLTSNLDQISPGRSSPPSLSRITTVARSALDLS